MTESRKKTFLYASVAVAAILWFVMFSPWTSVYLNFWAMMSCSAVILSLLSALGLCSGLYCGFGSVRRGGCDRRKECRADIRKALEQLCIGVAVAFALWGIFWIGDKAAGWIFPFADDQVDRVYGMKDGSDPVVIALLLLFLIGPAEEMFWRGFVQNRLGDVIGPLASMSVTCAVYALVHIWSFNFMLVMAALVAGAVWGFLYWLKPSWLPALVISHALWDALVFVILPI